MFAGVVLLTGNKQSKAKDTHTENIVHRLLWFVAVAKWVSYTLQGKKDLFACLLKNTVNVLCHSGSSTYGWFICQIIDMLHCCVYHRFDIQEPSKI